MPDPVEPSKFGLLFAFPDASESFVNGFEAGMLYQDMRREAGPLTPTIHTANTELVARMCANLGWTVEFKPTDYPEWTFAELSRASRPTLTVVK